jgi:hypothetical protein
LNRGDGDSPLLEMLGLAPWHSLCLLTNALLLERSRRAGARVLSAVTAVACPPLKARVSL